MLLSWLLFTLCVTRCAQALALQTGSFKILLLPANIPSHLILFSRLAEDLLSRGHDVTMVTGSRTRLPEEVKILLDQGLRLETFVQKSEPFVGLKEYRKPLIDSAFSGSVWDTLQANSNLFMFHIRDGVHLLEDSDFMNKLSKEKMDFVVLDYVVPSYLVLPHKFNMSFAVVGLSPPILSRRMSYLPSYVPTATSFFGDNMTFKQRFFNFLHCLYFAYIQRSWNGRSLVSQLVPEKTPKGFSELVSEASLFVTLRDVLFETPRPKTPDVIHSGNLMGRRPKPLPVELNDFVTSSKHGVIVVSFGSWLDDLPQETLTKMLDVFRNVQQSVLWKYNGKIPSNVPSHVKIVTWFPQNDVLGHPNVRVLLSHGGLNSLIESVFHAVPMVLMPIGIDQFTNAILAEDRGTAVVVPVANFSSQELTIAIEKVLNQNCFKDNVRKLSFMMRELQNSSVSDPGFWIEHVIRHGDAHLRSRAFQLPWYQFLMLDILAVVLVFVYALKFLVFDCILYKCKCFCIVTFQKYRIRQKQNF